MKIKRLEIVNFRKHVHSVLELEPFSVIKGGNHQGKSSIAQAISMVTTPSTMGLDATGRGFVTKIKRGASKAVLIADIQGSVHLVQRTVTLNTNTTGRTDSSICLDDETWHPSPFEKKLAERKAELAVILNTDRYFTLSEEAQKSLLAKLALPKQYDFAAETVADVKKILGEDVLDFSGEPFSVIEKAYKLLYKEREVVNRQVKNFVVPDALPPVAVDGSTLQAKLTTAREMQKAIAKERDEAIRKANEDNVSNVKLQGKVDSLTEKLKTERENITKITGILTKAKGEHLTSIAAGRSALDALENERKQLHTKIAVKRSKLQTYVNIAGAIGETCPTCQQEIDGNKINDLRISAQVELDTLLARNAQVVSEIAALGDVAGAEKALADHAIAKSAKMAIDATVAGLTTQLEEAKEELAKTPQVTTETEVFIKFTKPLDEVDAEITDLLEKASPAIAFEERRKEIEAKTLQLGRLKEKAFKVDLLVKFFDKDGIKSVLLAEHVGGFVEKMKPIMDAFGYKVILDIEPEFQFIVMDADNVMTPVKELSDSEKLMFAIALQAAVSRVAGIGIVVADRLDTFVPEERTKANKALYMLVKDGLLDQVVAIVSDTSETKGNLPNSAFFFVEQGTVRRL